MTPPPFVVPFAAISAADLAQVGGKGANLGELAAADFPVPPGFVVTATAFRAFLAGCAEMAALYEQLDSLPVGDVTGARALGERVRGALGDTPMPPEIAAEVLAAWAAVGEADFYAVRSSATAEDLPGASFAGQQDTYLNIRGAEALLAAVRDCWASLFTDRAILYRAQQHFGHRGVSLAVVVQRMVASEVSGILFTADPVTGQRHQALIESGFGLGEALVGGLITGDRFRVDTRSGRLLERAIAKKDLAIRPLPDGGTERELLTGTAATAASLTDAQALALAALGERVAAHYGQPQDLEWAIADGATYLVQSRPITTLFPLPEPAPADGALHVFLSFGHVQVMPQAMPPLALRIFPLLFGGPKGVSPYTAEAGSRLFIDLTPLLAHPPLRRGVPALLTNADARMAQGLAAVVARPDFLANVDRAAGQIPAWRIAAFGGPIAAQILARLAWRDPEGAVEHLGRILDDYLRQQTDRIMAAPAGASRLHLAVDTMQGQIPKIFPMMASYLGGGLIARALVHRLVGDLADPADLAALVRGLSGNVTTEMDLAVGDLADLARPHPELAARLRAATGPEALDGLATLPGGPSFLAAWSTFMTRYGMRGGSEIDISRPRWQDDPTPLLRVVAGNLAAEPGEHRRHQAELAAEGEAAIPRLALAARHGALGPLRATLVTRFAHVARSLLSAREHPKYMIIRLMSVARTVFLDAGAELAAAGRLSAPDDVWFLTPAELIDAQADRSMPLADLVATRRAKLAHDAHRSPPRIFTSEGELPLAALPMAELAPGTFAGTAASAGIVEGIARVILDPAHETLHSGEVLIAPFTDPGWTPLFINAAALVMEVGGLITHGSVVAREYGIPAVVGVEDATKRIRTGQRVRVDGDAGLVTLLDGDGP
jgi:pyruvate,water dikinase